MIRLIRSFWGREEQVKIAWMGQCYKPKSRLWKMLISTDDRFYNELLHNCNKLDIHSTVFFFKPYFLLLLKHMYVCLGDLCGHCVSPQTYCLPMSSSFLSFLCVWNGNKRYNNLRYWNSKIMTAKKCLYCKSLTWETTKT